MSSRLITYVLDVQRFLCFVQHTQRVVVLPPGGGGYSHTLPVRVCAAQRSRDFEAPDLELERGIHFRGVF